jgi:ribonuclease HI
VAHENPALSIYCDGASHDRGGWPGGWAFAVVREGAAVLTSSGAFPSTTNNQMELHAALSGLRAVLERGWHVGRAVELVSDSRVTLDIAKGSWVPRKPDAVAVALRAACVEAGASTRWVRGHSGDAWNERVDALAAEARQSLVPARVKKKQAARRATRSVT